MHFSIDSSRMVGVDTSRPVIDLTLLKRFEPFSHHLFSDSSCSTLDLSIKNWLQNIKNEVGNVDGSKKFVFVMGNEASDLDSIISTLSISRSLQIAVDTPLLHSLLPPIILEYISSDSPSSVVFVPVINIPSEDYLLRNLSRRLLFLTNVHQDDLIFYPDVSSLMTSTENHVILVDHCKPAPSQAALEPRVCAIWDHHRDENICLDANPRVITTVASTTSLIVQHFYNTLFFSLTQTLSLTSTSANSVSLEDLSGDTTDDTIISLFSTLGQFSSSTSSSINPPPLSASLFSTLSSLSSLLVQRLLPTYIIPQQESNEINNSQIEHLLYYLTPGEFPLLKQSSVETYLPIPDLPLSSSFPSGVLGLGDLILSTIIIDSVGMQVSAGKRTVIDDNACIILGHGDWIIQSDVSMPDLPTNNLMSLIAPHLTEVLMDCSTFNTTQLLKVDMKIAQNNDTTVILSSIPRLIVNWVLADDFISGIVNYLKDLNGDSMVLCCYEVLNGNVVRNVIVIGDNSLSNDINEALLGSNIGLSTHESQLHISDVLQSLHLSPNYFRLYSQSDPKHSRKQIMPIVIDVLKNY